MADLAQVPVGVVVPFFNPGPRLAAALASIAASSHSNLDVVLIDDASTDSAPEIARACAARDARFRYFRNEVNRRVSSARNRGLEEVRGDYILFVDADDRISPDWIANLLRDAREQQADVTIGNARRDRNGRETPYRMAGLRARGPLDFRAIVFKDNSVVWNKLYSAAWLRRLNLRFDESLFIGEDLLFNFAALRRAGRIFHSDRGFYYFTVGRSASIMGGSDAAARVANFSRLLARLAEVAREPGPENPGALKKVARDILIQARAANDPARLDPATLDLIRRTDRFLPEKIRLKFWSRGLRRRLSPRFRPTPADPAAR